MIKSGDDMRDLIRVKKLKLLVCIAIVFLEMLLPWNPIYAAPPEDENPPYLISVNRARNCVTIYKGNEAGEFREAVLSMVCSTAADGVSTPLGSFTLKDRRDWGVLTDGVYSPYITRIESSVLFVGSAYFSVGDFSNNVSELDAETYNRLGEAATGNGCIRLTDADAKWIYDNCPAGTRVEIYDDAENAGPLGKPEAIKIPLDHMFANWDPTNPDINNPWLQMKARIEGISDIEVEAGVEFSLLSGVTAYDTCGNDITSKIVLMGEYDFEKPGTYTITYIVEDAVGSQFSKNVTVTVKDRNQPETTTREPESDINQKKYEEKEKKNKFISVLALGFVTLLMALILLHWSKRD